MLTMIYDPELNVRVRALLALARTTRHLPGGQVMSIYEAAMQRLTASYQQ